MERASLVKKASIKSRLSSRKTTFKVMLGLVSAILWIMGKLAAASPHQLSVSTKNTSSLSKTFSFC